MEAEIIQLYESVATCPECKCQEWYIHINGFHDQYDKVTKHECSECGFYVDINAEVVKDAN